MIATESTYREKVETQARAKVFWGDAQADVLKYLIDNGTEQGEAKQIVEAFVHERADTVRKMGLKKILIGAGLMAAPLIPWIIVSIMMQRLFVPTSMILWTPGAIGALGMITVLKGSQMYLWPDTETGDIAEKD